MFSSEFLLEGAIYTRKDLREKFGITDATINTGVFPLMSYHAIWLFITEKKAVDATQYTDLLGGDTLFWDGQMEGHKDKSIIDHKANGVEILIFYRKKRNEFENYGFKYEGRFRYIKHTGSRPVHFVLERVETIPSASLKEAKATYQEEPNASIKINTQNGTFQPGKTNANSKPLKLIYCYAPKDRGLCDELDIHLAGLRHAGLITVWHNGEITPGKSRKLETKRHLDAAQIILLLISPDFIHSNYYHSEEVKYAIERYHQGETRFVPILLRPYDMASSPFSDLQTLPSNGIPVTLWPNLDAAFADVAKGIRKVAEELRSACSA